MCQAIPSCYDRPKASPLVKLTEDARGFLINNPKATDSQIKIYMESICKNKHYNPETLLKQFKENSEKSKQLANNPNIDDAVACDGVQTIQKMYYEFYTRVLSVFEPKK